MKQAGTAPEIYTPTVPELDEARRRFLNYEPRDLFYRVASELIELALAGKTSITVAEALAVLLQTWNAQYYQYHPFTPQHFADIEALLQARLGETLRFRPRGVAARFARWFSPHWTTRLKLNDLIRRPFHLATGD